MTNEQRAEWLDSLKVGDEVAVRYGFTVPRYLIGKIDRITPTRRFVISGRGLVFGNDGIEMGKRSSWNSTRDKMYPVTDEIRSHIARSHALRDINNIKFENLTTLQLLEIAEIIKQA